MSLNIPEKNIFRRFGVVLEDMLTRTQMLIGNESLEKLKNANVLVCGLGGVGGYALEALCRAGVGAISVLDNDCFSVSNLNRQILATVSTIGKKKVEVAKDRILSINPNCKVTTYDFFYTTENADCIEFGDFDFVIDAIDTVTAKLELVSRCKTVGTQIISCMGTGNKLGTSFEVADIKETSVCPLAKVMRKELKARDIDGLRVVYTKETPIQTNCETTENGRHIPGSISYAPAIAGFVLASEVIKYITNDCRGKIDVKCTIE